MKPTCAVPFLSPQIVVCRSGCVQLQLGPAVVRMTVPELRALAACVRDSVAELPRDDDREKPLPTSVN